MEKEGGEGRESLEYKGILYQEFVVLYRTFFLSCSTALKQQFRLVNLCSFTLLNATFLSLQQIQKITKKGHLNWPQQRHELARLTFAATTEFLGQLLFI